MITYSCHKYYCLHIPSAIQTNYSFINHPSNSMTLSFLSICRFFLSFYSSCLRIMLDSSAFWMIINFTNFFPYLTHTQIKSSSLKSQESQRVIMSWTNNVDTWRRQIIVYKITPRDAQLPCNENSSVSFPKVVRNWSRSTVPVDQAFDNRTWNMHHVSIRPPVDRKNVWRIFKLHSKSLPLLNGTNESRLDVVPTIKFFDVPKSWLKASVERMQLNSWDCWWGWLYQGYLILFVLSTRLILRFAKVSFHLLEHHRKDPDPLLFSLVSSPPTLACKLATVSHFFLFLLSHPFFISSFSSFLYFFFLIFSLFLLSHSFCSLFLSTFHILPIWKLFQILESIPIPNLQSFGS